MTAPSDPDALRARAMLWRKGTSFEDFTPGRVFVHHWGRTITQADNTIFTTLTLHYNPRYFNAEFARAEGHPDVVVCPMLVFNTVFGLSVQDLSEAGGMFLGIEDLTFYEPVYPGDTLTASSEVLDCREFEERRAQRHRELAYQRVQSAQGAGGGFQADESGAERTV